MFGGKTATFVEEQFAFIKLAALEGRSTMVPSLRFVDMADAGDIDIWGFISVGDGLVVEVGGFGARYDSVHSGLDVYCSFSSSLTFT